jgi:hypothetical protein
MTCIKEHIRGIARVKLADRDCALTPFGVRINNGILGVCGPSILVGCSFVAVSSNIHPDTEVDTTAYC